MVLARTPAFTPLAAVTTLPTVTGEHASRPRHLARDFLARVRADPQTRHEAREGGLALVAAYTDAVDHLVPFLAAEATAHYAPRSARTNPPRAVRRQRGPARGTP